MARQIACPVVLISSSLDKEQENTDFCMLSSISYVNLEPLILSTAFLKTSRTAAAALASKRMAISVLGFKHLEAVTKLENQSAEERLNTPAENLIQCGFKSDRLNSGLLYVKDSLLALGLSIFEQTELDQYIVVMAKVEESAATNIESDTTRKTTRETTKIEPLIRYNRLYATIDHERLSQGNDRYPV